MILFKTAKAEMAGKTKSFCVVPDFCTEKRNNSHLLPVKKMEGAGAVSGNEDTEFKV